MEKINVFKYKQYRDGNPNDVNARVSHVNYVIDGVNENFEMQPASTTMVSDSYVSLIKTNKSMVLTTPFTGTTELEGYKVCGLYGFDGSLSSYSDLVFGLELESGIFLPGNIVGTVSTDVSAGGDVIIQTMQNYCIVDNTSGPGTVETGGMDFYNDYYFPTANPNLPFGLDVYVEAFTLTGDDFAANLYYEYEFYLAKGTKYNFYYI